MRSALLPPILFLMAVLPPTAQGQHVEERAAPAAAAPADTGLFATAPAAAFAASLVLPGAGQAAQGQHRWVLYGALEVAIWTLRLTALAEKSSASRAYRDLAWEVAREPHSGPRQDGSWGYYETMLHYTRSGAFDRDPTRPGVQPEADPATYNGTVWNLARSLYLPGGEGGPGSPGYDRALTYYAERAAGPAFLWSWEGQSAALERFASLIDQADGAARVAGAALGAVFANHLVSAVDALVVARLNSESGVRLESRVAPADPLRWSVGLRIPIPD